MTTRSLIRYSEQALLTLQVVFSYSVVSGILCFLFSAAYHTFGCHSHKLFDICLRFDIFGIVMAMNGGMFASIFFGFYCFPALRNLYCFLVMGVGVLSGFAILAPIFSGDHKPQVKLKGQGRTAIDKVRALALTAYIGLGLVPMAHWVYLYGFSSAGRSTLGSSLLTQLGRSSNVSLENVASLCVYGHWVLFLSLLYSRTLVHWGF